MGWFRVWEMWLGAALFLSLSLGTARLQLKVVSYNVLYDTEDHIKDTHSKLRYPALLRLLREANGDVVVLQEVRHNFLRMLKQEFGASYHFSSDELSGGTETDTRQDMLPGGLLTMSRVPPLSVRSVMRNPEATYKSFLVTTHALGGKGQEPVEVVNVHLEHRGGLTPCGSAKRTRTLRHAMATVQRASTAVVVGDFNFGVPRAFKTRGQTEEQPPGAWKPETALVHQSSFIDVWPTLHPTHLGCTWSVEHNKMITFLDDRGWGDARIDRILLRSSGPNSWHAESMEIIGDKPISIPPGSPHQNLAGQLYPSDHFGIATMLVSSSSLSSPSSSSSPPTAAAASSPSAPSAPRTAPATPLQQQQTTQRSSPSATATKTLSKKQQVLNAYGKPPGWQEPPTRRRRRRRRRRLFGAEEEGDDEAQEEAREAADIHTPGWPHEIGWLSNNIRMKSSGPASSPSGGSGGGHMEGAGSTSGAMQVFDSDEVGGSAATGAESSAPASKTRLVAQDNESEDTLHPVCPAESPSKVLSVEASSIKILTWDATNAGSLLAGNAVATDAQTGSPLAGSLIGNSGKVAKSDAVNAHGGGKEGGADLLFVETAANAEREERRTGRDHVRSKAVTAVAEARVSRTKSSTSLRREDRDLHRRRRIGSSGASGQSLAGPGNCQVKDAQSGKIAVVRATSFDTCCGKAGSMAFVQGSAEQYCLGSSFLEEEAQTRTAQVTGRANPGDQGGEQVEADGPPGWLALLAHVEKEDPDIVCLQGLPDGGAGVMKWLSERSLLGHVSEGGGLTPGAVTGPSVKGPKGPGSWSYLYPGRVATFSRLPMKSVAFHRTLGSNEGMLLATVRVNGVDVVIANVPAPVQRGTSGYQGATTATGMPTELPETKKYSLGAIAAAGGGSLDSEAEVVVVGDVAGWSKIGARGGALLLSGGPAAAASGGACATKAMVGVLGSPKKALTVDRDMEMLAGGMGGGSKCMGAVFGVSVSTARQT